MKISLLLTLILIKYATCWTTRFFYYASYGSEAQEVTSSGLLLTSYSPLKQTIFVVHGYNGQFLTTSVSTIRDALLQNTTDNNVIVVDWSGGAGAGDVDYLDAVKNSRITGQNISQFISRNLIPASLVYCVGFSLGAHVCGFAGKDLRSSGSLMKRITGLDPAAPKFSNRNSNDRLLPSDADFVDVIYTSRILGTRLTSGHMNFFPNFNQAQPTCVLRFWLTFQLKDILPICNHHTAWRYYADSISSSCSLRANLCDQPRFSSGNFDGCRNRGSSQTSLMGYYATKVTTNGFYIINTRSPCTSCSYCRA